MPDEARLILAFGLALAAAFAATPLAISVATRTGFNDKPIGYKGHTSPTPYLGGAAVVTAFILAGLTVGGELSRLSPIVALAFGMWCLGTYDDRRPLSPRLRLTVEFAAASTLWAFDLGWSAFDLPVIDLIATNLWVVGLMNAFNLMDNMDGAAATVGAVTTMTTAVLALVDGDVALAVLCAGMSGACLGFLPYNLSGPARIFLGDGGSLPVGFVVAATIMVLPDGGELGWTQILAAVILAGLPVVDTALVMISRRRAGIPLLTGGRDHMTHRLLSRLGSPRTVAVVLGADPGPPRRHRDRRGPDRRGARGRPPGPRGSPRPRWPSCCSRPRTWAPVREPRDRAGRPAHTETTPVSRRDGRPGGGRSPTVVEGSVIVFITVACGISPAFFGFYRLSVWGPIALFLLAGAARPRARPPVGAAAHRARGRGGAGVPLALVAALDGLGRVGRPGAARVQPLDALRQRLRDPDPAAARRPARQAPAGARPPRSWCCSPATWWCGCSGPTGRRSSSSSASTSRSAT